MDSNQLRFLSAGFTVRCPSAVRAASPKIDPPLTTTCSSRIAISLFYIGSAKVGTAADDFLEPFIARTTELRSFLEALVGIEPTRIGL